jgi:hypothetical protein
VEIENGKQNRARRKHERTLFTRMRDQVSVRVSSDRESASDGSAWQ